MTVKLGIHFGLTRIGGDRLIEHHPVIQKNAHRYHAGHSRGAESLSASRFLHDCSAFSDVRVSAAPIRHGIRRQLRGLGNLIAVIAAASIASEPVIVVSVEDHPSMMRIAASA